MFYFKSILILTLFIFVLNSSYCQLGKPLEKVTLVKANGEKVEGLIKAAEIYNEMNQLHIKQSIAETNFTVYDISSLQSVTLSNGDYFQVVHISINNGSTELNTLARQIIKGKASLYECIYNLNEYIYLIKRDSFNYVLQNDSIKSDIFNSEVVYFNYEESLKEALEVNATPLLNLNQLHFNENYFIQLVSEYNRIKGSDNIVYDDSRIKSTFIEEEKVGFVQGSIAPLNLYKNEFSIITQYRLYYPKLIRGICLNAGISYYQNAISTSIQDINGVLLREEYRINMLSMPITFQVNLTQGRFRLYAYAGVDLRYVDQKENTPYIIEKKQINSTGVGSLLGLGIEYDFNKNVYLKIDARGDKFLFTHFGIGYRLKK